MSAARAAAGLALTLLAACGTPQSRIRKNPGLFASWPPEIQSRVKAGEVDVGFTAEMVRMALGSPDQKFMRTTETAAEEVWIYGGPGLRQGVGVSVGGGTYGGFGGGVSVGSESPRGENARIVFAGGRVVSVEKRKR